MVTVYIISEQPLIGLVIIQANNKNNNNNNIAIIISIYRTSK